MINKHFIKTIFLFALMIGLGLASFYYVSYLDEQQNAKIENSANVEE
jgi:predicted ABC-type exoprotein transport system permease subunit